MLHRIFIVLAALLAAPALAQDKVTFLTSWYAQAEHGGFYQALATGLYKKQGLDVTLRMGGPQVNGMQLMMAGQADMHMGYDFQVLKGLESGLTPITVATSFQHDLQGLLTHPDVKSLADLKDKTILVATAGPIEGVNLRLLAANNQVLADENERLLIKGRSYKVAREESVEEALPDGRKVHYYRWPAADPGEHDEPQPRQPRERPAAPARSRAARDGSTGVTGGDP